MNSGSATERQTTRIEGVMASIRSRITARSLLPGARLPSVRVQAKAMKVSVSTVVEAYERLVAEGLIHAQPGSGFYVSGPLAPLALAEIGPKLDREVDPLWISRQALEAKAAVLKPGCGWLPATWMYEAGLRRALRALARADAVALADYAPPLGLPALRQALSRRMAGHGIEASPSQILLTESGTHALDLICRFLLEPGDTVLLDDPCYFNFHALLKAHRVKIAGVPYTTGGPDIERFEAALKTHAPRLYITNSAIQNPTGAELSAVTAHKLLKLADRTNLVIVEDDIFADFELSPAPRLAPSTGWHAFFISAVFPRPYPLLCVVATSLGALIGLKASTVLKIATNFGGGRLTSISCWRHSQTAAIASTWNRYGAMARSDGKTLTRLAPLGIIRPWLVAVSRHVCLVPASRRRQRRRGCAHLFEG